IFYEMLSGRMAFERDTCVQTSHAILDDDPPPFPAGIPAALVHAVRRCLAKRPEDRFQSAHDVVEVLASAATSANGARALTGRTRRWLAGVGTLLVALAV